MIGNLYKSHILAAILLFFSLAVWAQDEPFKTKVETDAGSVRPGDRLTVTVTIDIAPKHYLYAERTDVKPGDTEGLTFGEAVKPAGKTKNDPVFGPVKAYEKNVAIRLPVTVSPSVGSGKIVLPLTVKYQGCTESMCFMPEEKQVEAVFEIVAASADDGLPDFAPEEPFVTVTEDTEKTAASSLEVETTTSDAPGKNTGRLREIAGKFGFIGVIVAAFAWGFLASLTPCVYPIIPITVSVISAGSGGNAFRGFILSIFYVLGMSLVYAVFGVVAAWSGGLFGEQINHPAVRIVVSAVLVILALGMFDVIYIQMPSFVSSKLGGYSGTGTLGVFLTGAVSGAVVGPCVGPMIIAILVYIAAIGDKFQGFFIMWSFALGMGMLFLLIGTFSGFAASMPKAGMWMEKLKRFFGVVMLALALYFLEPLLPGNLFFLVLGAFLTGLGIFTGALDKTDAESTGKTKLWKTAGVVMLALGIGYIARFALDYREAPVQNISQPSGISWISSESDGLASAKDEKKPVMVDFTAEWCTACKKMERETFTVPSVVNEAKRFVCIKIDGTDTKAPDVVRLVKKYNVIGFPTVVFIDSDGNRINDRRITKFVTGSELLERMRGVE